MKTNWIIPVLFLAGLFILFRECNASKPVYIVQYQGQYYRTDKVEYQDNCVLFVPDELGHSTRICGDYSVVKLENYEN